MSRYGVRLETDPRLTPQDCQALARRAEDLGYESVWLPEGRSRDAFTSLAAMALATENVRLGTGIVQIFARTASNTAMAAAGMAALSGGRFILGLGTGHGPSVETWDGVPFNRPMTRLRETIQIARGLLSGDRVDFSGKNLQRVRRFVGRGGSDGQDAHLHRSPGPPDVWKWRESLPTES